MELAVNIDGAKYYVEGTDIDDYDAHSGDGFCNAIRDAKIQGQIVDNKYIVTDFKLIGELIISLFDIFKLFALVNNWFIIWVFVILDEPYLFELTMCLSPSL